MAVLGISLDSVEDNRAFAEKFDYPFPLLCDVEREVAQAFGAVSSREDQYAARYTFVIGPDGKVEQAIDTKSPADQAEEILGGMPGM